MSTFPGFFPLVEDGEIHEVLCNPDDDKQSALLREESPRAVLVGPEPVAAVVVVAALCELDRATPVTAQGESWAHGLRSSWTHCLGKGFPPTGAAPLGDPEGSGVETTSKTGTTAVWR